MKKRDYINYSGILFLVIAIVHLLRSFLGWEFVIGSWAAPMWVSWAVVVVAGYLAYSAHKLKQ